MKPTILVTMGDPAGIGPEIALFAVSDLSLRKKARLVLVGCPDVFTEAHRRQNHPLDFCLIKNLDEQNAKSEAIECLASGGMKFSELKIAELSLKSGEESLKAINLSTDLCFKGEAQAVVTAPVCKEAIELTGASFSGHTEWIADRVGQRGEMMLMAAPEINVAYATTHVSIDHLPQKITQSRVLQCLKLIHDYLNKKGAKNKLIGVCGLNPHAGENGLFGLEEKKQIKPAILEAIDLGIEVEGPMPADTLFVQQYRQKYAVVLAMYHDQGGIPFKMLAFDHGVNLTLGLPIVRTSVDHGTAFDIAWKGSADSRSMICAIEMAIDLSPA